MSDDSAATASGSPGAQGTAAGPGYSMVGQYIRDLSFENPGAPMSNMAGGVNPTFNVSINVRVNKQADDLYAVELTLTAKATREETVLFNVELVYGGVFRLRNVTEQQLAPLLMVECPRLVFPFARQVLATTVQQGGFPPLMMEPVDFQALYLQNLRNLQAAQQKQDAAGAPAGSNGGTPPEAPLKN